MNPWQRGKLTGTQVIGTVNGMVHVLTYDGAKVKSYRPHAGSITCLKIDEENDFIATASFEGDYLPHSSGLMRNIGRVMIHSLTTPESYAFDYKRPMQTISLEPGFAKKNTKAFVCGGMAGSLMYQEKGWMGWKEQILHSGEGPIWATAWRGELIAWANDSVRLSPRLCFLLTTPLTNISGRQDLRYLELSAHRLH